MDVASLASGILNFAGNKLASKILEEFGSTLGVEKSLDELKEIVEGIKSILQNVEDKLIKNDPSLNWLKKLKHVAYDIDDVLNEFYLEAEKHSAKIEGEKHVMIKCFFEKPNSILFRHKMAIQIKTIKGRFREILSSITDFNTIRNSLPTDPIQDRQLVTREASLFPIVDETKIFGRDQDKSNIIRKLIETNDREVLPVISIIGIGGLGKTSLAKLVFNDENEIKKHFEVRIWVYVSLDFLVEKLIGKLFEAIIQKKSEFETVQFMIKRISEKLTGKRFLLVLDDVWNKDQHKWDQFILHIKGGAAGSRILLTTRNQEVVDTVKSIPYNLEPLSKDDSWKLFQQSSQKVEKDLDSDFIDIGKGIVMKCGGVPLAVRTVGSIVGGKKEINSWLAVRDCELWNVENGVFTSLMLSYSYLPSYLQQCFLYCSIFPKGYAIKKHHLIDEWIAHGFITLTNDIEQLEDVGNEYFDSLLKMWFLQDLDEDEDNGTVTCKMHDLVHDLARYILQKEIVSIPKKITNDSATICRYLSLTRCTEKIDRKLINKVRSIYVDRGNFTFDKPIKKARHLRILILEDVYTISLSPFILKLEHLGCLRVSSLQCEALPEVISCCWNLQALHVINCRRLATLPKLIGKLKKLRTLDLSGAEELECLPESIGDCCNLQSLHLIGCKSLKEIPNSIGQNKNIRMLNLSDCGSLKELPSESFGMLQNIQSINLHRCSSIKELPNSIIQLGKLHSINLSYCSRLVYLPEGIINLMKLKVLNLKGCEKLRGLPVRIRQLTRLQTLGLFVAGDGRKYAKMSELRSINMINGDLQIKNIRYIKGINDDGEKAYLKKKNDIRILTFEWSRSKHKHRMEMEQEQALLNDLEPPPMIVKLRLRNYPGWQTSHWMMDQIGSLHRRFPLLTHVCLENLPHLNHLPRIVELPYLKTLKLKQMPGLESISGCPFPSLVELWIYEMPNLVELWTTTTLADGEGEQRRRSPQQVQISFPCLSVLHVCDCPKLKVNPYLPSSLKSLHMYRINEELLVSTIGGLNSTDAAGSGSVSSFQSFPLLKRLVFSEPSTSELLQHLTTLKYLGIKRCKSLRELPECMQNLTSLQQLQIRSCHSLTKLPEWLGQMCSLQTLWIRKCDSLSSLPQSMAHLTSLQLLIIEWCAALQMPEWEWLGELSALQHVSISGCPGIKSLPRSIQCLTSLQQLFIRSCTGIKS